MGCQTSLEREGEDEQQTSLVPGPGGSQQQNERGRVALYPRRGHGSQTRHVAGLRACGPGPGVTRRRWPSALPRAATLRAEGGVAGQGRASRGRPCPKGQPISLSLLCLCFCKLGAFRRPASSPTEEAEPQPGGVSSVPP